MNESVFNLIPAQAQVRVNPAMYRSKHRNLAPSCSTFGLHGTSKVLANVAGEPEAAPPVHPSVKATGSFGKSVADTINPRDFLKCSAGATKPLTTFKRSQTQPKAAVPSKFDKPVMGLTTDKNFVVANAVESILTAPKRLEATVERAVDKQNFGQTPAYLNRIKAELKTQQVIAERAHAQEISDRECEVMSEDEIEELRASLKVRQDALTKQFQTLSFTLETATQKKRKEMLERSMQEVEAMLKKLGKRRIIVVDQ